METIKHYFKQLIRFINVEEFECDSCQREFEWGTAYSLALSNKEFEKYPAYCEYCVEIAGQELNQELKSQNLPKKDQRTLNKTGRIHQLGTRVRKEFLTKLKRIARKEKLKYVEVLEKALEAYSQNKV